MCSGPAEEKGRKQFLGNSKAANARTEERRKGKVTNRLHRNWSNLCKQALLTTWVKMASLFWMLLTVPENSRISVDSSTMSAGRSLHSITSCEPSTLEKKDGQNSDHGQGGHHWHSGCMLRMFLAGLKVQLPFCTLQRCIAAGTRPQWKRLLGCQAAASRRVGSLAGPPVPSHLYTSSLNAGIS